MDFPNNAVFSISLHTVKEYEEGLTPEIARTKGLYLGRNSNLRPGEGRLVIRSYNESGCRVTETDLLHILKWVQNNAPELLEEAAAEGGE